MKKGPRGPFSHLLVGGSLFDHLERDAAHHVAVEGHFGLVLAECFDGLTFQFDALAIHVEADSTLPYAVVVTAMAVAKQAGVPKVLLLTDPTTNLKLDDLEAGR